MTLHVGVIGAGQMGSQHARNLANLPDAEVVSICDSDPAAASRLAGELGASVTGDAEALIADARVQAVVIASPHETHPRFALRCIAAEKPVFCEKPLALDAADALQVVHAEERSGRRLLQLGFMREFDAAHRRVCDEAGPGAVGTPLAFHGLHVNPPADHPRPVDDVLAGSVVHDIHSARWLLASEIEEVFVRWTPSRTGHSWSCRYLVVMMRTAAGQIATVECDAESAYGYEVQVDLVGDRGAATTRGSPTDGRTSNWGTRFAEAYRAEMIAWVEAARGGGATGPSALDGWAAQAVVDACIASARLGTPVRLS